MYCHSWCNTMFPLGFVEGLASTYYPSFPIHSFLFNDCLHSLFINGSWNSDTTHVQFCYQNEKIVNSVFAGMSHS